MTNGVIYEHIKVFVSSTVYGFESQLNMVYSILDGYGYGVMMPHITM